MNSKQKEVLASGSQESSMCPTDYVIETLRSAGHKAPEAWLDKVPKSQLALIPDNLMQRKAVNDLMRLYLAFVPGRNTDARFFLIDVGTDADWKRLFKQGVVTFIMANDPLA